ncbi:WD40 repeat-like protein [Rhizoclosmatium globosum]|uniref:WD40 repeat-like protein n=1 Tax=Rhizoclosmatium globosum TaxID=329046 RepID=A0A1Y2B3F0_9FUNG|nr:WD40 repeat-like protein [Rhizoclosmatium globosum]|eukprot:ORY29254.1 WD40 repeat-like protein [Rhizoclosmatium globosum]
MVQYEPLIAPFAPDHSDLVHDIQYDFYGKRIATCSSDQRVKVWHIDSETEGWEVADAWKAHDCSIVKVAWAHPEFGSVLASCSYDRSIKIWEEQEHDECPDPQSLSLWSLTSETQLLTHQSPKETDRLPITWCPSRFHPPQLVIATSTSHRLFLPCQNYRLSAASLWMPFERLDPHSDADVLDVAWAPNMGRSYELVATGSRDGVVRIFKLVWIDIIEESGVAVESGGGKGMWKVDLVASLADHGAAVWRVSWNLLGTVLSSCGEDGKVRVWRAGVGREECQWVCSQVIGASDA